MLFVVVERFKGGDAKAVYRRFRDRGRGMPDGVTVHGSWTAASLERCFMVIECDHAGLIQEWVAHWADLVDFEIVPVATGQDTAELLGPLL